MAHLSRYAAAAAIAATALLTPLSARADEGAFLDRFAGVWSGGGVAQRKATEDPHRVRCHMKGSPSENAVSISGTCRAAVIFSRQIRADIRFDPSNGRYSGTYIGSRIGPAKLSGKRNGDSVVLAITWPKPVNGDRTATMTIRNSGAGKLAITVADKVAPGGPTAKVTDLALAKG